MEGNINSISSTVKWDRESSLPPNLLRKWFNLDTDLDIKMAESFKKDLLKVESGQYQAWKYNSDIMAKLAYIILCD